MNYALLFVILLICGAAYYEHTVEQQEVTGNQKKIADQDTTITSLQATNQKLTDDKTALAASLTDAKKQVADLTLVEK